jgi:ribosome-binding protein aMBF1 (putative translation factor)
MILGTQVRAARALLGWTVRDLAPKAVTSVSAVNSLEGGAGPPAVNAKKLAAIQSVLEAAGIEFLDHDAPGVRLHPISSCPNRQ